jgi:hypothetical protein
MSKSSKSYNFCPTITVAFRRWATPTEVVVPPPCNQWVAVKAVAACGLWGRSSDIGPDSPRKHVGVLYMFPLGQE